MMFILSVFFLQACTEEDPEIDRQSLQDDLTESLLPIEKFEIVACAAGGEEWQQMKGTDETVSMFFYPKKGASNFRYYETLSADLDSTDYSNYFEIDLEDAAVFNGYLWRFLHPNALDDVWGIVTYELDGSLLSCEPVRIRQTEQATELKPGNVLIDFTEPTQPKFTWTDGSYKDNVIYFQVISDPQGNLISGTYTTEKQWTFYDLSNVVFNITDPDTEPTVSKGGDYHFTLMAVTEDNWVNMVIEKDFTIPE